MRLTDYEHKLVIKLIEDEIESLKRMVEEYKEQRTVIYEERLEALESALRKLL
jgi:hypothetical protein